MKKSLLLIAVCLGLGSFGAYAQDDDVYFVPSSKAETEEKETYTAPRSSYTTIDEDERFGESNWAEGRTGGNRDVDDYNRRGRNYKGGDADSVQDRQSYDEGYDDGYEDGSFTSRLVRFWSPRAGVYVSSPYYMDYYDLCYYDPWYYGYGSPWSWGWSGWYGWGSWYGWRPYYSSLYWGWGWGGWYDPWWGGGWHHGHGWYPSHWYPSNAQRGPLGGYIAYGGRRGSGATGTAGNRTHYSGRPSSSFGYTGRGNGGRGTFGTSGSRPSRNFGNSTRPSRNYGTNGFGNRSDKSGTSRPSRSFGNSEPSRSSNRSSFSSPSRSSGSFNRGSFGGGGRSGGFGGGGSRGGGGRR